MAKKPVTIVKHEGKNFCRMVEWRIEPKGVTVSLVGLNMAGKTSTMDAITAAIAGERFCPADPIRHGEKNALVRETLSNGLTVERTWQKYDDGRVVSKLEVRGAKGEVVQKPQSVLDALYAKSGALDPFGFIRAEPKVQVETLIRLADVKFDFGKAATARKEAYDLRTEAKRELAKVKALVDAASIEPPGTPIDVDALLKQQEEIAGAQRERGSILAAADLAKRKRHDREDKVNEARRAVAEAEAALKEQLRYLGECIEAEKKADFEASMLEPEKPAASLREEISKAQAHNEAVKARQRELDGHAKNQQLQLDLEADVKKHDTTIEILDHEREIALAQAKYPLAGLGFLPSGEGVMFNGVPLAQASGREKWTVGVALARASNPEFGVMLVRDAALIDPAGLTWLKELGVEYGLQIWLEKIVSDGGDDVVTIQDGSVA